MRKHKCDGREYKGEHQEMMFKPMGVCTKGTNLVEATKFYDAETCPFSESTDLNTLEAENNQKFYYKIISDTTNELECYASVDFPIKKSPRWCPLKQKEGADNG